MTYFGQFWSILVNFGDFGQFLVSNQSELVKLGGILSFNLVNLVNFQIASKLVTNFGYNWDLKPNLIEFSHLTLSRNLVNRQKEERKSEKQVLKLLY